MDFTRKRYAQLLDALLAQGYVFYTFEQYCEADKESLPERMVILRHDIDLRAPYALEIAKIEYGCGAFSTAVGVFPTVLPGAYGVYAWGAPLEL